jgi:FkbM family methyltransferase
MRQGGAPVSAAVDLALVDGVRVVVPDSVELITPYVLREQHDWFEDEIKFVRRLLQPGEAAIDVGANYGVYTLSMAKVVGAAGRVWAFEPATKTAALLAESILLNGFRNVTLERRALSSAPGAAQLVLHSDSEMNALVRGEGGAGAPSEIVELVSLDGCMESRDWKDIAFVKLDAEGEESNILRGGQRFFEVLSPLVQYEIKAGAHLHLELVEAFASMGYDTYRLVPGLGVLVPFVSASDVDPFLLNLFCCKPERAAQLEARGLLASSAADPADIRAGWLKRARAGLSGYDAYHWRNTLVKKPYGAALANLWQRTVASGDSRDVERALALYVCSRDGSLAPAQRYGALELSFRILSDLSKKTHPSHLRLASLARVARDYGERAIAANALGSLCKSLTEQAPADVSEPFLAPGERFDALVPRTALGRWVRAGVLEEFERSAYFSSFYAGASARSRLELICDLDYASSEMERRLQLVRQRYGAG